MRYDFMFELSYINTETDESFIEELKTEAELDERIAKIHKDYGGIFLILVYEIPQNEIKTKAYSERPTCILCEEGPVSGCPVCKSSLSFEELCNRDEYF